MAQAQGTDQSTDASNRDLGILTNEYRTMIEFNNRSIQVPSPFNRYVFEQQYGSLEIRSIAIHHLGGSAEAANSLLDFIASKVSSSGITSIDFSHWGTFDTEATIDHQHLLNLAKKCGNLRSLTMNFMGYVSSQLNDTIWNMVLTMVKQASSLSSLNLHCSGLGGSG